MKNVFIGLLNVGLLFTSTAFADVQKAHTYSNPKSKCKVTSSADEYPTCRIMNDKKELVSMPCESGITVLFSSSGKYIALGGGEISPAYKGEDHIDYGLAIFNCHTEKMKGYLPTNCAKNAGPGVCIMNYYAPTKWKNNDKSLEYTGEVDGNKLTQQRLKFTKENPLPN
jgi:hypothetical protein